MIVDATDQVAGNGLMSRRFFMNSALASTAVVAGGSAAFAQETSVGEGQEDWTLYPGDDAPEYGDVSQFEKGRVKKFVAPPVGGRTASSAGRTPLHMLHGTITPSGLHFEVTHHGVPDVNPDIHKVVIHGMVDRPLKWGVEDLENYPTVTRQYFMECSGNTRINWAQPKPDQNFMYMTHGLVSGSEWTGVPLSTLLDEAGVSPDAKWIIAEGGDSGSLSRSIPIEKAMDDSMVALYQNGERIRPSQGYPMRVLNPGFEGNTSVKWIRSLYVTDKPVMSRFETSKYTDKLHDGKSLQFSLEMDVKSVITRPSNAIELKKKGMYEITGLAWSGKGKIAKVEVSADGGRTWADAMVEGPVHSKMLTRFRIPWMWKGMPAVLQSRATDEFGQVQPSRKALLAARGKKAYYHYHAVHSWSVNARGKVRHVYA
ncbi:MAG: sulfite dehydrogenase [Kordiimonadaceae bacterium]|nr:sulfite dehydrogenase [Kordiimonadaceae bacterium]